LLRDAIEKGPADGLPQMQLRSLPSGGPIIDLSPHLNDFADTAAAMSQLDLAIMTDSAVAHLTAAMAKPVWLLLGHVAHWLWLSDRQPLVSGRTPVPAARGGRLGLCVRFRLGRIDGSATHG
jgi:hypothetical protein